MIHVYYPHDNTEHESILRAMHEGIARTSWRQDVKLIRIEDYRVETAPDIAVIFGVDKIAVSAGGLRGRVLYCQGRLGKRTLVIEKGYVNRSEYYAVGWEGLNGRADFCVPSNPGPERRKKTGIELQPVSKLGHEVLLVGQVPWDASVQFSNHVKWVHDTAARLMTITSAPIRFRPHPLGPTNIPVPIGCLAESNALKRSLDEDLAAAMVVVTFNSNVAVDAILRGIPVIAMDPGSMVWGLVPRYLEYASPEQVQYPDGAAVQRWMNELAYKQWSIAEMHSGEAWEHITRKLGLSRRKSHHDVKPKDLKLTGLLQQGAV